MTFNVGVDIESVSRFKKNSKKLFEKMFSKRELKNANSQHLAGIFCAKEAVIKACSPVEKLQLRDIEILHEKSGMPFAAIKSKKISKKDLRISISHSSEYAIAAAILVSDKN